MQYAIPSIVEYEAIAPVSFWLRKCLLAIETPLETAKPFGWVERQSKDNMHPEHLTCSTLTKNAKNL